MKKIIIFAVCSTLSFSATCKQMEKEYVYYFKQSKEYHKKGNWKYVNIAINRSMDRLNEFKKNNCYEKIYKKSEINNKKTVHRSMMILMQRYEKVSKELAVTNGDFI